MSEALIHTLSLLYDLQFERGIALLPANYHHLEDIGTFEARAEKTYETLTITQKVSPDFWALLPQHFFGAFGQRMNAAFRTEQVPESLMHWYIFNLEHPIHQMALSLLTGNAVFTPAQTSALIHFIASLSYLAQLRDMGANIYIKAEINALDNSRLKNTASSYHARERLYLGLADDTLKQMIDAALVKPAGSLGQMDALIRKIIAGQAKGLLATTSLPDWLDTFNSEISALRDALFQTIRQLAQEGQELALQTAQGHTLDSDVEHQITVIGNLPLFRGLSEATLRNLLKGARLLHVAKNTAFLTQGESLSRFFIVMDGWVKTVKSTAEGQETILQILGKKEAIFDNGFVNAPLSNLTAKAVTNALVLSISLPILRDHASRNRELAQNMLFATTSRLQRLVAQFEQITLKSATERVGWFLVNLHLETGLDGAPLKLPFDKSLIAAYLNIKPETFSRVLKEFKDRGFSVEKDQIVLPTPDALCRFCDPDMALRCCRAESVNCLPILAARRAEGK